MDFFFGAHNAIGGVDLEVTPGVYGSLATRRYNVMIKGLTAHAGVYPQKGNNALLAAATAVQNLYAIPRHGDGMTRINVGKFISGTSSNVISDETYMEIEMRGESTELIEYMDHHSRRILESAAQMHGCTLSLELKAFAPAVVCDLPLAERVYRICKQYLNLKTAVISCGEKNVYGHPTQEVLENLNAVGAQIYRTDEDENILISVSKHGKYQTKFVS